uniref:non-specific serine/threonine protein kinase n=1 Tax=Momordica charantia TaxID=3673 RepID=A0A6J1CXN3_MOMCH
MHFLNSVISFIFSYLLLHSQAFHPRLNSTTDQDALLSFKSSVSIDPHRALDSWHPNTSFCLWRGVLCNPIKRRVTGLTLPNISLVGTISPQIASLSFLHILDLQNNSFSGKIPSEIHRLFRLKNLILHSNNLHGPIPPSLSHCSMLRVIDLSINKLQGTIPSGLGGLLKLQFLSFEGNKLSGSIPSAFGNLSSLHTLILGGNHIEGPIPSELGRLNRLLYLHLGNNKISGGFPATLLNMSSLSTLEFPMNEISGELPPNLFNALPNLKNVFMGANMLRGHIPESLSNASNIKRLDLSSNQFSGEVPLLWQLGKIETINVELNFLTSEGDQGLNFVTSLSNSSLLKELTATTNLFSGQLPPSIGNLSAQLYLLYLSENQLSGNLPQEIGNLGGLNVLTLDSNSFTGKIPSSLGNLRDLQALYLYTNFLSGSIPESLGNLSSLSEIGLNENNLSGGIPLSFSNCKRIKVFDVSANGLSGSIPKEIFSAYTTLGQLFNVSSNYFSGSLPDEIGKMKMVETLDVSRNQFSGPIPSTIQDCLNLHYLDMSRNSFQGPIPSSLSELKGIEYMDLSSNRLSAKIPLLDDLPYLQYLNLSSNKLQGEVPRSGIFLNMSAIFLSDNVGLCGGIVELGLPKCAVGSTDKRKIGKLIIGVVTGAIGLSIAISLSFVLKLRFTRRKQLKKSAMSVISFEGPNHKLYSYHELRQATENFNSRNLIGKGSFGSVYKGVLEDETEIAIKVFDLDQQGGPRSFLAECEIFRNVRHRNLLKIISACSSLDFKALILEFMPNGNLETWLHRGGDGCRSERWLNLKQRLEIALDVGVATEYLHHGLENPVVHCDLKPSNVLLDEDMRGHVGDFGLARLLQLQTDSTIHNQSITSRLKGSIGYIAPEYGLGVEISTKGDVYSYGILLLEMITGRSPVDEMFCGEMDLKRWVAVGISDSVVEILDEKLQAHTFKSVVLHHLTSILNIGLKCASELPEERPEFKDVLAMMKKIWVLLSKDISSARNNMRCIRKNEQTKNWNLDSYYKDRTFNDVYKGIKLMLLLPHHSTPLFSYCSVFHPMKLFSVLLVLVTHFNFLHHSQSHHPHFDNSTDQDALLNFKSSLTSDPNGILDSWNPNSSFCNWHGVLCNPIKHRVLALRLAHSSLAGTISPLLANLSFLQILDLRNNTFSGEIPADLHRLFRLKLLDLSFNNIHGLIPPSLSSCLNLRVINFSRNSFHGKIPSEIGQLSKLRYLNFDDNEISGEIPSSFGNLSSLNNLRLRENNIGGSIPPELGRLRRLQALQIGINNISGEFPTQILNVSSIVRLNIAANKISGTLPSEFFTAFPNLAYALMAGNRFHGFIPSSLSNASELEELDLPSNQFSGRIPPLWKLGKIRHLNLEDNNLTSGIEDGGLDFITSLTNSTFLQVFSVSKNQLTGQLPSSIGNLSSQVYGLYMAENQLDGAIPEEIGNLGNLGMIQFESNFLTGKIPSSLGNLRNLEGLILNNNFLSGSMPAALGNLTKIVWLALQGNNLSGEIPRSLSNCGRLVYLDLGGNGFTGYIPKELFILTGLIRLNVSSNEFTGYLPSEIGRLKMVETLDVSRNQFSGPIPSTIQDCLNLYDLNMSTNSFQGPIPSSLAQLKGLEHIDLSSNLLSAKIPSLDDLRYLQYLNLSSNNLQGEVPKSGIFLNKSAVFLSHNPELCGGIVELGLPKCPTDKKKNWKLIAGVVGGAIGLCIAIALCFVSTLRSKKKKRHDEISFEDPDHRLHSYSYYELKHATRDFSDENLIGKGSFGSVYKGVIRGETPVAIKVIDLDHRSGIKGFLTECEVFRNTRHRNLVKILSVCSNLDFKALVLEFMPNGNLETWLHRRGNDSRSDRWLTLKQRIDIALDVAAAMEYLHHGLETPVVHCDLKPSNVLLDEEMTAHVADFGLSRLLQVQGDSISHTQSSASGLKGSIGYIAPEYAFGVGVSTKGDVYSYGILLLEMFTGRSPVEEIFNREMNLQRWVEVAIPNMVIDILDERLKELSFQINVIDYLVSILITGLRCASELPNERPEMKEVCVSIKKIRSLLFK